MMKSLTRKLIAEKYNEHFVSIGDKLAKKIPITLFLPGIKDLVYPGGGDWNLPTSLFPCLQQNLVHQQW